MTRLTTIGIIVAAYGIIGAFASIAQYGLGGVIVSGLLTGGLFIVCWYYLRPVISKTPRGTNLFHAIESVGLTDIESREDESAQALPPPMIYRFANREILISGISLYRTFDQHIDMLRELLDSGVQVYCLILNPDCPGAEEMTTTEEKDIPAEIRSVIEIVSGSGLLDHAGFRLKMTNSRPPFTGILIDGDVEPTGAYPNDKDGLLRVQPGTQSRTQHRGVVLQFIPRKNGAFECFAQDFRYQWSASREFTR